MESDSSNISLQLKLRVHSVTEFKEHFADLYSDQHLFIPENFLTYPSLIANYCYDSALLGLITSNEKTILEGMCTIEYQNSPDKGLHVIWHNPPTFTQADKQIRSSFEFPTLHINDPLTPTGRTNNNTKGIRSRSEAATAVISNVLPQTNKKIHHVKTDLIIIALDLGTRWMRLGYKDDNQIVSLLPINQMPFCPSASIVNKQGSITVGVKKPQLTTKADERVIYPIEIINNAQTSLKIDETIPVAFDDKLLNIKIVDLLVPLFELIRETYSSTLSQQDVSLHISIDSTLSNESQALLNEACIRARIDNFRLHNTNEALVHTYAFKNLHPQTILLIDLGRSQLSISIASRDQDNEFKIDHHKNISELSASRLDLEIYQLAFEQWELLFHKTLNENIAQHQWLSAIEHAHPELNQLGKMLLQLEDPDGYYKSKTISLSQKAIEEQTHQLVILICQTIINFVSENNIPTTDIYAIVLSGSAGHYPQLKSILKELFNKSPLTSIPANQATLVGLLNLAEKRYLRPRLMPANTLQTSIGIELQGGRLHTLVTAGQSIPFELNKELPESLAEITFFQGDKQFARECTPLGHIKCPYKVNTLHLSMDREGVMIVTAVSRHPAKQQIVFATQQTPPARKRLLSKHRKQTKATSHKKAEKKRNFWSWIRSCFENRRAF